MGADARLLIVGHGDVVEKSLVRYFRSRGAKALYSSTEEKLDVLDRSAVAAFMEQVRPEQVILTSVRSGGIGANQKHPAEFIYENLQAQNNVIDLSYRHKVEKFLFLAASCIYPKECSQPMKEESFLTGLMEKTSEPYSMAKAAGVVMCQAYRRQYGFNAVVGVPATVYGPGGLEDLEESHVMGALIGKFSKAARENAAEVVLWGTGEARREFIFGDDLASACGFLLAREIESSFLNIGIGSDVTIRELAGMVAQAIGFKGKISWDHSKPDGAPRKLLDSSTLLDLGWRPSSGLAEGIATTVKAYQERLTS